MHGDVKKTAKERILYKKRKGYFGFLQSEI
jgi:hypothetical protein